MITLGAALLAMLVSWLFLLPVAMLQPQHNDDDDGET
jgi:hypothetical protein